MLRRIGIAIHRTAGSLVGVEMHGDRVVLTHEKEVPRSGGTSAVQVVADLLRELPVDLSGAKIALALSAGDLAASESWLLEDASQKKGLRKIAPTLSESRCAGETLEDLYTDLVADGLELRSIALERAVLHELRGEIPGDRLLLITSIPAALAQAFGEGELTHGGERTEVRSGIWRSTPMEDSRAEGHLEWNTLSIPKSRAAALAAAIVPPEEVPDALRGAPELSPSFLRRYHDPLVNLCASLALAVFALGMEFHERTRQKSAEVGQAQDLERKLFATYLPGQSIREGRLVQAMEERLSDFGQGSEGTAFPSALALFGEIVRTWPDSDALGLALEGLDLSPDGGRLSARVPVAPHNPMKNAQLLESALGRSDRLSVRGDYDVREGQVQARLRVEYRP